MTQAAPARPNDRLGRYTVTRVTELPEISATVTELTHELGARHLHIARDDENSVFAVTFPTIPHDSTGVAHILEHMVLSGSKRYPLKSPFFAMTSRSLNTFMNAMTGADRTFYPFATRNARDFDNLLGVYLDATFFPLLTKETFAREAWRLEHATPTDPTSELRLQGVVYNEMKGGTATPGSALSRTMMPALYPNRTYRYNSGGDPAHIPDLTYDDLRAFHAKHYHPSNAYFFTYGRRDLNELLEKIEDLALKEFARETIDLSEPEQPRLTAPVSAEQPYASHDEAQGAQVSVGWLLEPSDDPYAMLKWEVLEYALLGSNAAPLRRALLDSGLGSALADGSGFSDSLPDGLFRVGLKGLNMERAPEVEPLVLDTLRRIADEGVPPALLDAAVHQLELGQREVSNAGAPYGLKLLYRVLAGWTRGGDPLRALNLDADLDRLAQERASGAPFEDLIREGLLANTHRVTATIRPDPEHAARLEAQEQARVEQLSAGFTPEDQARVAREATRLAELQSAEEDLSGLPTLQLSDVPVTVPRPDYQVEDAGAALVGRVPQPTNGIAYLDVRVSTAHLSPDELDLLPLYAYVLTRSGAAGLSDAQMSERIQTYTGGVGASAGSDVGPQDLDDLRAAFTLSGKALGRNAPELVAILHDLLARPELTAERSLQLLGQSRANAKGGIVQSGHVYALRLAAAQVNAERALQERQSGLTQLALLERLEAEGGEALLAKLQALGKLLLQGQARLCLTAMPADVDLDLTPLTGLFGEGRTGTPPAELLPRAPQARLVDAPVSYNAVAYPTVPYTHPDAPALLALSHLFTDKYLMPELREKGGAYGGFASYQPQGGVLAFASYRDPNFGRTFGVFRAAADFVDRASAEDFREAVLSAGAQLDPLTSPDTLGRMRFFGDTGGYTPEVQEAFKAKLLGLTLDDLRRVARTYLREENAAYASVTGKDPEAEGAELGLRFETSRV